VQSDASAARRRQSPFERCSRASSSRNPTCSVGARVETRNRAGCRRLGPRIYRRCFRPGDGDQGSPARLPDTTPTSNTNPKGKDGRQPSLAARSRPTRLEVGRRDHVAGDRGCPAVARRPVSRFTTRLRKVCCFSCDTAHHEDRRLKISGTARADRVGLLHVGDSVPFAKRVTLDARACADSRTNLA
jgi:hypothetical protein